MVRIGNEHVVGRMYDVERTANAPNIEHAVIVARGHVPVLDCRGAECAALEPLGLVGLEGQARVCR